MQMQLRIEDLESTTLQDMRDTYIKDMEALYQADITDSEYWEAYHYCNHKLKEIEQELKVRGLL